MKRIRRIKQPKLKQTPKSENEGNPKKIIDVDAIKIYPVKENTPVSSILTPQVQVGELEDDQELYRVRAFWLFDPFPNELIIRKKSLHVIYRTFLSSQVETMLVSDIGLVTVNTGFMFSSLIISYRAPHEDLQISKIASEKAFKAKAILDSLLVDLRSSKSEIFSSGGDTEGGGDEG